MKFKSDAFNKFKEWCMQVENEKNCKLKCLRTDNGLEFVLDKFQQFCVSKGIKRHKTVPFNPQQNGVIERMNRAILEKVRCMLSSSGLPKKFWAETVATACFLINRLPSSAVNFEIPEERWLGREIEYSYLRVFGCLALCNVRRGKLESRALRTVLIGYPPGVKGYKLWCIEPGNNKMVIS